MAKTEEKNDTTTTNAPEGWRPEPGDMLVGTVAAVSRAWSDWSNSFYPLVTIKDEDGKHTDVHAFHHTLKSRLMEVKPKVGERIEVVYEGKTKTKDGKREVAVYRVTFPDATGEEVWSSLDEQDSRAARAARPQSEIPVDTDGLDEDIPF